MKKERLLFAIPLFLLSLVGCDNKIDADLSGYSKQNQTAIKDFVKEYGKNSKNYKNNAYIVSDFDNTTAIFDIALQCAIYQIETMSFAMDAEALATALTTSMPNDSKINDYIIDATVAYNHLIESYGEFTASGVNESELSALHNDIYWQEFSTKLKSLFLYVEDTVDDALACEWIMYWYSGMTSTEVYQMFKNSCEKYKDVDTYEVTWTSPRSIESRIGVISCSFIMGCSVTESVKNMLKLYADNGIDTWICSASHADGVSAAVDAYGLSDYVTGVIGMTQKQEDGKYVPAYDYETGYPLINGGNGVWNKLDTPIKALPSREGKVTAIKNALLPRYNCGPLAGFMDASGDFNFCTEFSSMKMVICYNRANRKITDGAGLVAIAALRQKEQGLTLKKANQNGDTYYLLQGRDENGKRSLRESNYTVRFGEVGAKLFANEDNYALYNYLKVSNMNICDFFNHFVIKTSADNSVIHIAHGYLSNYAGYHSI